MKSRIKDVILSFEPQEKLGIDACRPLCMHAVINCISPRVVHDYLIEKGLKVSYSTIKRRWSAAAEELGLKYDGVGRQSLESKSKQRIEWGKLYRTPSLQELVDGWELSENMLDQDLDLTTSARSRYTDELPTAESTTVVQSDLPTGHSAPPVINLEDIKPVVAMEEDVLSYCNK